VLWLSSEFIPEAATMTTDPEYSSQVRHSLPNYTSTLEESDTQSVIYSIDSGETSEYIPSETSDDREFVVSDTDQLSHKSSNASEIGDPNISFFSDASSNESQEVSASYYSSGLVLTNISRT
jgi:hypothetical protein